jgi:tripartite-type tricarboxylate transporter receptor subunit TctC
MDEEHELMKHFLHRVGIAAAAALLAVLFAHGALAQQYPTRPIKIMVTIPPGGAPDIAARVIGQKLEERLGQPVVVENRPGANGNVAGDLIAKSAPDGYTLILAADSLIAINPHLYAKMPFDTLQDLVPVASLVSNMFVLSVNPSLPVKTFQEFIEYARKANPPLAYGSSGNGSQHQLTMEMLKQRAGIKLVHVPYKGGAPSTTATVAGEVSAMFAGTSTAPQIKAGKLRALAVTGSQRSSAFPDLPTIAEFYPGFETTIWLGLFGPAGMPEPVLARLRAEIGRVLAMPEVKERLGHAGGLEPFSSNPAEFAALIRRDYDKYGKIVKQIGATVD